MTWNIFITALEEQQRTELETVRSAEEFSFKALMDVEKLIEAESFSFSYLMDQARQELKQTVGAVGSVAAIVKRIPGQRELAALRERFHACLDTLHFEFDSVSHE